MRRAGINAEVNDPVLPHHSASQDDSRGLRSRWSSLNPWQMWENNKGRAQQLKNTVADYCVAQTREFMDSDSLMTSSPT